MCGVHACVYMCSHGCGLTRECMHVYICMNMSGGWRSILGVFPFCSQSYIYVYWQDLSAKLGLVVLTSLARQLSRGTLVSVPPVYWDYKWAHLLWFYRDAKDPEDSVYIYGTSALWVTPSPVPWNGILYLQVLLVEELPLSASGSPIVRQSHKSPYLLNKIKAGEH